MLPCRYTSTQPQARQRTPTKTAAQTWTSALLPAVNRPGTVPGNLGFSPHGFHNPTDRIEIDHHKVIGCGEPGRHYVFVFAQVAGTGQNQQHGSAQGDELKSRKPNSGSSTLPTGPVS